MYPVVNRRILYPSPSPGGKELDEGGDSPSANLSLQGRGIKVMRKTINRKISNVASKLI